MALPLDVILHTVEVWRGHDYDRRAAAEALGLKRQTFVSRLHRAERVGVLHEHEAPLISVTVRGASVSNGQRSETAAVSSAGNVRHSGQDTSTSARVQGVCPPMTAPEIRGAVRLLLRQGGNPDSPEAVNAVTDQLARGGVPLDALDRISKVKLYSQAQKGPDGKPVLVDAVSVHVEPGTGEPAWPVVQPGPPVEIHPVEVKQRARVGWRTAVVLPDMQIGYHRRGEALDPTHDERALNVARQIVRAAQPDVVVMVGDNLDLPEHGRYRKTPSFAQTTQAAIDRATTLMAELRADAGADSELVWLEGNHEARLPHSLLDNAMASFGLRQGNRPEAWPALSVPNLCRLDEIGVNYVAGYPAGEFWINDRLRVVHGHHVRKGSTAHVYLGDERHSTLYGHVHRIELAHKTRHTRHGPRQILAGCFGCLCRVDGAVPGARSGVDLDGNPVGTTYDWQQGMGVVNFKPGDAEFVVEVVPIFDGWALWRGGEYVAHGGAA